MLAATALLTAALLTASPDAPVKLVVRASLAQAEQPADNSGSIPAVLQDARRLASELRYEEAVVAYQRYLALENRPIAERARAHLELGFIHLLLGDERNAERRAFEALSLDPTLRLPAEAPTRLEQFLASMREKFESRTRVEILPPADPDRPQRIRVRLTDPRHQAKTVLLRHALATNGPFYGQRMRCDAGECTAEIAPAKGAEGFTAWYFVEALDEAGNTVARGASAEAPLQVSIVQKEAWYQNPWVYAGGAAAVVGAAAVFFVASAPR